MQKVQCIFILFSMYFALNSCYFVPIDFPPIVFCFFFPLLLSAQMYSCPQLQSRLRQTASISAKPSCSRRCWGHALFISCSYRGGAVVITLSCLLLVASQRGAISCRNRICFFLFVVNNHTCIVIPKNCSLIASVSAFLFSLSA